MRVIGLSGYARSGKDSVASFLVLNHGFQRIGFADALKDVMFRLDPYVTSAGIRLSTVVGNYGWERAKDTFPEVRRLLQQHGGAIRDVLDPDAWVHALTRQLRPEGSYVIPDMRFPNELHAVRHELRGLTVRVHRPGYGPVNGHISETALDGEPFGAEIWNSYGLDHLEEQAAWLVSELNERATA